MPPDHVRVEQVMGRPVRGTSEKVAEIKTGKRRVLDYLLSPLHRYGHDVLHER